MIDHYVDWNGRRLRLHALSPCALEFLVPILCSLATSLGGYRHFRASRLSSTLIKNDVAFAGLGVFPLCLAQSDQLAF